jgi:hypothetical protein
MEHIKIYGLFLVLFTLLELFFSGFYFLLVKRIDITLVTGTVLYAIVMLRGIKAYQFAKYQRKRRELLDSLL